ncbi:MAG: hypothetical protein ABUS47_06610 [Steroidobacter sp.]
MPEIQCQLLRELISEVRGLRADLKQSRVNESGKRLVHALDEFFGTSPFTVFGLLTIADEEPHSDVANALADCIDLNASPRSRATQLGKLLSKLPQIEIAYSKQNHNFYCVNMIGQVNDVNGTTL